MNNTDVGYLVIGPETLDDAKAIHEIVAAAFGRESEARLVELLRADEDAYIPKLALVAEAEGVLLGHVMLTHATVKGKEEWQVLALGPLAVLPDQQRKGVGAALTQAALDSADQLGYPLVVLLGHPTYYPRFGFESARSHGIQPPVEAYPDEAFMVKTLSAYDERIKGTFAFAPAFDEV